MAKYRRERSEKGFFLIGIAVRSGRREKVLPMIKTVIKEYAKKRLNDDELRVLLGEVVLRVVQEKEDIYFELNQSDVGIWDVIKIVRDLRKIKGVIRTSITPLVFKDLSAFRGKHLAYGILEVKAGQDERVMDELKLLNRRLDREMGQLINAGYCFSQQKYDIILYMSAEKLSYLEKMMDVIRDCSGIIDTEFYLFRKFNAIQESEESKRRSKDLENTSDERSESVNMVSDYERYSGLKK